MVDYPGPPGYRLFDHTADLGIEVTASSMERLFETAAAALFDLIAATRPGSAPRERIERRVTARGDDREELLVRWLSELLYLHDVEGIVFREFLIDALEPGRLAGRAWGEVFHPDRHSHGTGIKAVTYHEVAVRQDGARCSARLVLDV